MDITQDINEAKYSITGYETDCVFINQEPYKQSLIISPDSLITDWEVMNLTQLNNENLIQFITYQPEIVIIGTGEKLVLPDPKIIAFFAQHRIGFETMNTAAACRTYGILAAEARKIMVGIVFPET